jgi:hypothetical protein
MEKARAVTVEFYCRAEILCGTRGCHRSGSVRGGGGVATQGEHECLETNFMPEEQYVAFSTSQVKHMGVPHSAYTWDESM